MRRMLSLILALILLVPGFCMAEEIQTYDPEKAYGNPDIPYGPMVAGLIRVNVDVEEPSVSGKIVVYTPADSYPCVDTLLVLGPDGSTAEQLAADAQWQSVADAEEICVVYAEAPEGKWNIQDPAKDIAFLKSALSDYVGNKLVVDWNERALYAVGYGEGGTMVHELAMSYPAMFAGIVSIGGCAVPDEFLETTGNAGSFPYVEAGDNDGPLAQYPNNTIPVPAWIINCGEEGANAAVAEYWKAADKVVDEGLTNAYGRVFRADRLTTDQLNNEQPIAEVWVSDRADALAYSADFNSDIWTKFLSRIRRFVGDPGSSLRAAFEPEDLGMRKISLEVDGLKREFYVYTPSTYTGDAEMPLVVCIHGYSSTARAFTTDTEWWRVAENRGLICAFVQAYPHTGNNVPRWLTNNSTIGIFNGSEEQLNADLNFIKAVAAYMDENYAVDDARRYVTGHSNGGMMTCAVADAMPELFAAAAPVGGMDIPFGGDPEHYSSDVMMPMYGIVGDHDLGGFSDSPQEGANYQQMVKWAKMNGLDIDKAKTSSLVNGRYNTFTLYDQTGCAPLAKFALVENSPHAYFPELAWKIWDEFFSRYTRGEDQKISYEGIALQ